MKLFKIYSFFIVLLCIATTVLSINVDAPMAGHHGKGVACRGGPRRWRWWANNGGNGSGNSTGTGDANGGGANGETGQT